jgi:hypothetical protein
MPGEIHGRCKLDAATLVELIEPCLCQLSQGGELGTILGGLLLQKPEASPHHFAGVAIPPRFDLLIDKNIE